MTTRPRRTRTPATTVLLVRHGRTGTTGAVLPGRAAGLHLDDTGRAQAARAAEQVGELPAVAAVYTSPLERARETAAPIAAAAGVAAVADEGLLECDFGEWTGRPLKELRRTPEWRTVQHTPSVFRFPGGESFAEMQGRVVATLERLRRAHPGGTIVAVSHADPIKAALAHAVGVHLDLFQRLVVSTCSISAVSWPAGVGPIVLAVNVTGRSWRELAPS